MSGVTAAGDTSPCPLGKGSRVSLRVGSSYGLKDRFRFTPAWGSQGQTDGGDTDRLLLQVWGPLIWAPLHRKPGAWLSPPCFFFQLALVRASGRAAFASLRHASTTGSLHRADPFSLTFPLMRKQMPGMAAVLEGQSCRSPTAPRLCPWSHPPHVFPVSLLMCWGAKRGWERGAPWKSCVQAGTVGWKNDEP